METDKMKNLKRAIQVLAFGACAAAVAPAVHAEAKNGFYMGLSAGNSSFDLDKEEFDDIVLDAFFSQGASVLSGTSTLDNEDRSFAIVAGYRFLPYVAFEASFLDLGTLEYRSIGTVNPPGPVTTTPASVNMEIESKGLTASFIGSAPLGRVFDLHGRLGLFIAQTDLSVDVAIGSNRATETNSLDSVGTLFGVGAGFHFGENWSLSIDWTRYANVGDEDEDEDYETEEGFDIDSLSLTATFTF
jgi:hypothetical protein